MLEGWSKIGAALAGRMRELAFCAAGSRGSCFPTTLLEAGTLRCREDALDAIDLILIGVVVLGFGLVSGRIEGSSITAPMLFVAAGLTLGVAGRLDVGIDDPLVETVMEITLVVVLFTDASRIDLRELRREFRWPLRMLGIGLPLTVVVGTLLGVVLLPHLSVIGAVILAIVLAPTDAALGDDVVANPRVPSCIRQTLNVESGLNDGLALPLLTIALAVAGASEATRTAGFWTGFALTQIGLAIVVGVALGWAGGYLIHRSRTAGWMNETFVKLTGVTLALLAFAIAGAVDASGFIAAFVAGAVLGATAKEQVMPIHAFAEAEGSLLVLVTFLLFGAIAVRPAFEILGWRTFVYAMASLTVVRMVPVALSLLGSGLRRDSVWFLAWFGPRGLASILFGLLVLPQAEMTEELVIFPVVVVTVVFSVVLHGVTAAPWARRYARAVATTAHEDSLEMGPVMEMPVRARRRSSS